MTPEDNSDLAKRAAHFDYIFNLASLYDLIRKRKNADPELRSQITPLERHIAEELKEFLNG